MTSNPIALAATTPRRSLQDARVLIVGMGGLGCPAAIVLARAGVGTIGIVDDDRIDITNLHRQILFDDADVGRPKTRTAAKRLVEMAADALAEAGDPSRAALDIEVHETRLLPNNAVSLVTQYDLIVEGSDNFATKFLTADACAIAGRPVVHAAAVRWHGTALAVGPRGGPCYRCLFEDVPLENVPNCAQAGVVGPMVGVVAAAQADLALGYLVSGEDAVKGELFTFNGKSLEARRRRIAKRPNCPLCGEDTAVSTSGGNNLRIRDIEPKRYVEGLTGSM